MENAPYFFAVDFLVVVFRVDDFLVVVFLFVGPFARFSARRSTARSCVIVSGDSSLRRVTFVEPSVMYGPKRPSLMRIGFSLVGSVPSSASGGFAAARPRCFGCA